MCLVSERVSGRDSGGARHLRDDVNRADDEAGPPDGSLQ